jgi:hypothetical protein
MSTLQDFLNANPIDGLMDEVAVSERFKDKGGKLLKFKIKAMDGDRFEEIRKKSLTIKAKGRKGSVELDMQKFNSAIVIEFTLDPDFKDAASIQKAGCINPEQYLKKVLLPGEIDELSGRIQKLSGYDQGMDELVEEAKN